MPIYSYKCPKCDYCEDIITTYEQREQQTCTKCSSNTTYTPSFRFNATNLPNGFANTRSKSKRGS